jgi:hypothetical protein
MCNKSKTYQEFQTRLDELGSLLPLEITRIEHLQRSAVDIKTYQQLLDEVKAIYRQPDEQTLGLIQGLEYDLGRVVEV